LVARGAVHYLEGLDYSMSEVG